MDFLATYAAVNLDGALISKEITGIMGCQVGLSKDLYGSDLQAKSTSGTTTYRVSHLSGFDIMFRQYLDQSFPRI